MQRGYGQQRAAREAAAPTAQRFAGDIENARQNRAGIDAKNGPGTRLAFAGQKAETADVASLDEAKQLLAEGADSETVRQKTGWFRGMDGKWRFEIDDRKMKVTPPESRFNKLRDVVEHSGLFAAYPDLADVELLIEDLKSGENGKYNPTFDSISISREIARDPEALKKSLVHEIQHAVQNREGFTSGASPEYWDRQLKSGGDTKTKGEKKERMELWREYNSMRDQDPDFVEKMEDLRQSVPDEPRGKVLDWDTLESEPDPPAWVEFDKKRDELTEEYGSTRVWDFMRLQDKIEKAEHNGGKLAGPNELYYSTAGEVEARDVQKRLNYSAEARKNTRPDIDREDVVFAGRVAESFDLANAPEKRSYIEYKDRASSDKREKDTAVSLISKGKVVQIKLSDYSELKTKVDWADYKAGKEAVKKILEPFIGKDLYFKDKDSTVVAYLTRKGVNHAGAGGNSFMKSALYFKFLDLVSKAEYSYSTRHDPHAVQKQGLTPIAWDSYVSTAFVEVEDGNGISIERYDVVFKLESVAEEVRSRLYAMWAKKETAVSHDTDISDHSDDALPNYGATTASEDNIAHSEGSVKKIVTDEIVDWAGNRGTMFSPAEEEDGVDEGNTSTGLEAGPPPLDRGGLAEKTRETEDAEAVGLARDKKVALAKKVGIDGLKAGSSPPRSGILSIIMGALQDLSCSAPFTMLFYYVVYVPYARSALAEVPKFSMAFISFIRGWLLFRSTMVLA